MKINDHYHKGPVQDLLNAVVVQAVEDYREYSAKLIVKPGSRQAAKDLEEVKSFFLSEDFCFYTKVGGDYILKKLDEQLREDQHAFDEFRAMEAEVKQEAKKIAMEEMKKQFTCVGITETCEWQIPDGKERLTEMIKKLRKKYRSLPDYIRKYVKMTGYEATMQIAYARVQEDILNGKESLWG